MRSANKIVWLSPGFAANENDTTAIPSLQLLARYIKDHNPSVELNIITFQYPFRKGSYTWHGIPVWSAGGKNGKLNRIMTWIRVYRKLQGVKRESGIDLLHAFWLTEATLIGKIFCLASRVPFLATTMGQDVKPENHYLMLIRYLSIPLILISDWQATFLARMRNLEQVRVIPFGINEELYNKKRHERTIDILGAGSLNRIKDFKLFIGITGDLVKRFPGIRCVIIGDGAERADLEDLIMQSGLENTVELAGQMDYESVIDRMHQARYFLHTSSFEGQGLVITEALAAGLTVVSFPVGIAATLKSKKLFTGKSKNELTEHLVRLLNDTPDDFQPEIHYTIAGTGAEYDEIYSKLMIKKI